MNPARHDDPLHSSRTRDDDEGLLAQRSVDDFIMQFYAKAILEKERET